MFKKKAQVAQATVCANTCTCTVTFETVQSATGAWNYMHCDTLYYIEEFAIQGHSYVSQISQAKQLAFKKKLSRSSELIRPGPGRL